MLLHLIKKDILLVKNNVLFMMFAIIAIPFFIAWRLPEAGSFRSPLAFIYMVVMGVLMICMFVSTAEAKYPKAASLLCALPYSRTTFVMAKYVLFLLIFAYCFIVHTLVSLILSEIAPLSPTVVLASLLGITIIYGIYMPCEFKFGYEKTKFVFMLSIFTLSFGTPLISNLMKRTNIDFSALSAIPAAIQWLVLAAATIMILFISVMASIKIYSGKEL